MARVRTGIEVLAARGFAPLKGKRVGLVTNPTGVLSDLRSTIDALAAAPGVRLGALFGPEHGVRGDVPAGKYVASAKDPATGLPVYSLYGRTRRPTGTMIKGLDVLVFDIQDIGARSYTYLSTLGNVMEAAAEHKIPLLVLDRPNPLGGERVEGSPAEASFRSFVGQYPVPYLHGMTLGEMARLINGRGWLPGGARCELTVLPCENWTRATAHWEATGLPWVPTSPHIPRPETAWYYAATGIVGELPTLSIGVGYTLPFELAGAPGLGPASLAREMTRRGLTGVRFRPMTWTPFYNRHQGKSCGGVQIHLTDAPPGADLTRINFELMDAVRRLDPDRPFFASPAATQMFDLVCGADLIRKAFQAGAAPARLWDIWNQGRAAFLQTRKPYLLYR
jgi:uncharacterized protein YbbC (DUF1343 family)